MQRTLPRAATVAGLIVLLGMAGCAPGPGTSTVPGSAAGSPSVPPRESEAGEASVPPWPSGSPRPATFDGRFAIVGYDETLMTQGLYVVDGRGGGVVRVTDESVLPMDVTWSPDGRSLAASRTVCPPDPCASIIFVVDVETGVVSDVTSIGAGVSDGAPMFSPDGQRLVFQSNREAGDPFHSTLFVVNVDGSSLERVPIPADGVFRPSWSPDGEWIVYTEQSGFEPARLVAVRPDGTGHRVILERPNLLSAWAFSSDGSALAFVVSGDSHEVAPGQSQSTPEIWIASADGANPRPVVGFPAHGNHPRWASDGASIAFVGGRWDEPDQLWIVSRDGAVLGVVPVDGLTINSFAWTGASY